MAYLSGQPCSDVEAGEATLVPQLALPLLIYVLLSLVRGYRARYPSASDGKTPGQKRLPVDEEASECLSLTHAASFPANHDGGRSDWVDSYRFWLVACVIVGHTVSWPVNYHGVSKYFMGPLILWMDTFSMPGLALLSGICARGPLTWQRMARMLTGLLLPYLFSRFVKFMLYTWFTQNQCVGAGFSVSGALTYASCLSSFLSWCSLSAASDAGIEWYLISLIQWRLAASFLRRLWPEALLAISFGIGILSGYFDVTPFMFPVIFPGLPVIFLSIPHRTMSFLPFFAAGLLVDPVVAQNALRNQPHIRRLARVLLVVTFVVSIFVVRSGIGLSYYKQGAISDFNYDYITARVDLEHPGTFITPPLCGPEYHVAGCLRALRYVLCFAMMFVVWASAWPSSPSIVEAGRHTMYPYLLHQWPVSKLDPFLFVHPQLKLWTLGFVGKTGWLVWVAGIPLALSFTYLSTQRWVRCIFGAFIEPHWALCGFDTQTRGKKKGLIC